MSWAVADAIVLGRSFVHQGKTLDDLVGTSERLTIAAVLEGALAQAENDHDTALLLDLRQQLHVNGECQSRRDAGNPGVSATAAGESGESQTQDASHQAGDSRAAIGEMVGPAIGSPVRLVTPPKPADQDRADMLAMLDEMRARVSAGELKSIVILADAVEGGWSERASGAESFPRWVGELTIFLHNRIAQRIAAEYVSEPPPSPAA